MRVLFTLLIFKQYTGSELVTLDQANYFINRGDTVDIFAIEADAPLDKQLPKTARLITPANESSLYDEYDLIISRQWPLLEYLIFTKKINAKRIYFESISWRLPIDFYPYFYSELTMCGYVSQRVKNTLQKMGYEVADSFYFPNYTKTEFADYRPYTPHAIKQHPDKLAIVSNHPPTELEELVEFLDKNYGVQTDIYGMHHKCALVTPELLEDYDVIVSIGKTVFFALSMGIPCYLYDETCSIGYVTPENYQQNLDDNMASSKGKETKRPIQIADEIIAGYPQAVMNSQELREKAARDFLFDDLMEKFLSTIMKRPEMNMDALREKYPYSQYLSPTFIDEVYFDKTDIQRWHKESLRLGASIQEEWAKYSELAQLTRDLDKRCHELESDIELLLNSKGWRFLETLRKPLKLIKKKRE